VIGGFFFLLFLLLVGRLYVLQIKDHKQSEQQVANNSLRVATIPASRGLILDRNGTPMVDNVTTVEIRLSRAEATLDPAVKGTLASLTGLSVNQIRSDLANKATARTNPRRSSPTRPRTSSSSSNCTRRSSRASRCSTSRDVPIRWAATLDPRCSATSVQSPETRLRPTRAPATRPTRRSPDRYRGLLRAVPARSRRHEHHRSRSNGSVIGTLHTTNPRSAIRSCSTSTPDSKVRSTES